jgi:hypothetical protein
MNKMENSYSPYGPPLGKNDQIVVPRNFHKVTPGDLFAIWLGDGRLGLCLAASCPEPHKARSNVLVYTFSTVATNPEEIQRVAKSTQLTKEQAAYIGVSCSSMMQNGAWPYIGRMPSFVNHDWPLPCQGTDIPNQYCVLPMDLTLWGDTEERRRVKKEVARWFIEPGIGTAGITQLKARRAIDQNWRGIRPRWDDPKCYPACFDPWEVVVANIKNELYWSEKLSEFEESSRSL